MAKVKIKAAKRSDEQLLQAITQHSKRLKELSEEHGKEVDKVAALVRQARTRDIPMKRINQAAADISRQWLYAMNNVKKRNNGNSNS